MKIFARFMISTLQLRKNYVMNDHKFFLSINVSFVREKPINEIPHLYSFM